MRVVHSPCAGYDGAVVCTDCMENGNNYSNDLDYMSQGLGPGGLEYQQHPYPMEYSPPLGADTGPYTTPLCNGTPNGVRRDVQPHGFPSNHDATTSQRNHSDRKGTE